MYYQYQLPRYLPTADELPCSDDTPVDEDWSRRFPPAKEVRNELQELIPSLLKSILRMWMPEIGLGIGCERANYDDLTREWLYWYDETDRRYPTPYERAKLESQRAELESQRAELESQRADRLAAKLRALGIEPD